MAGILDLRGPGRGACDPSGRQVAGSGRGRQTAADADSVGMERGGPAGGGVSSSLLPARGGDRPARGLGASEKLCRVGTR